MVTYDVTKCENKYLSPGSWRHVGLLLNEVRVEHNFLFVFLEINTHTHTQTQTEPSLLRGIKGHYTSAYWSPGLRHEPTAHT